MNQIKYKDEIVNIGYSPWALEACGFRSPSEVRAVAIVNAQGEPVMRMDDVVAWFKAHVPQD